jgi:hypothetical protein
MAAKRATTINTNVRNGKRGGDGTVGGWVCSACMTGLLRLFLIDV